MSCILPALTASLTRGEMTYCKSQLQATWSNAPSSSISTAMTDVPAVRRRKGVRSSVPSGRSAGKLSLRGTITYR